MQRNGVHTVQLVVHVEDVTGTTCEQAEFTLPVRPTQTVEQLHQQINQTLSTWKKRSLGPMLSNYQAYDQLRHAFGRKARLLKESLLGEVFRFTSSKATMSWEVLLDSDNQMEPHSLRSIKPQHPAECSASLPSSLIGTASASLDVKRGPSSRSTFKPRSSTSAFVKREGLSSPTPNSSSASPSSSLVSSTVASSLRESALTTSTTSRNNNSDEGFLDNSAAFQLMSENQHLQLPSPERAKGELQHYYQSFNASLPKFTSWSVGEEHNKLFMATVDISDLLVLAKSGVRRPQKKSHPRGQHYSLWRGRPPLNVRSNAILADKTRVEKKEQRYYLREVKNEVGEEEEEEEKDQHTKKQEEPLKKVEKEKLEEGDEEVLPQIKGRGKGNKKREAENLAAMDACFKLYSCGRWNLGNRGNKEGVMQKRRRTSSVSSAGQNPKCLLNEWYQNKWKLSPKYLLRKVRKGWIAQLEIEGQLLEARGATKAEATQEVAQLGLSYLQEQSRREREEQLYQYAWGASFPAANSGSASGGAGGVGGYQQQQQVAYYYPTPVMDPTATLMGGTEGSGYVYPDLTTMPMYYMHPQQQEDSTPTMAYYYQYPPPTDASSVSSTSGNVSGSGAVGGDGGGWYDYYQSTGGAPPYFMGPAYLYNDSASVNAFYGGGSEGAGYYGGEEGREREQGRGRRGSGSGREGGSGGTPGKH
ncbi:PE domain-containing protein [Balamuthia mandrillaris]